MIFRRESYIVKIYGGQRCDESYIHGAGVIDHIYQELVLLIIYTESWCD